MSRDLSVKVIAMDVDGERCIGFEIPREIVTKMNLQDGEILKFESASNGDIIFKRTNIITNDD